MRRSRTKVIWALGVTALVGAAWIGAAHAAPPEGSPDQAEEESDRHALFQIDRGLPLGGYFKLGRFKPAESAEPNDDWLSRRSRWSGVRSFASIDRTFMAVEAGKDKVGVRGFVSAAGESQSGELEPRFTANAFRRWGKVGKLENVITTASAATGHAGERRYYAYSGSSRFRLGPLEFLGYGAVVDTELSKGTRRSWSAHAEAGWRLTRHLDTALAYEWLDPNEKRRGDERSRIGVRMMPTLREHMRGGVCYRKLSGPGNGSAAHADELALELHVSF